ncbi:hypothetical protein CLAIMM_07684, partial [Cladophialophora immunda]
ADRDVRIADDEPFPVAEHLLVTGYASNMPGNRLQIADENRKRPEDQLLACLAFATIKPFRDHGSLGPHVQKRREGTSASVKALNIIHPKDIRLWPRAARQLNFRVRRSDAT